ncbi:YDG/SRA domain-containing protein [Streptomyces triculaminicus]|uniref:YDG/SRA domain-containing protein n=1 Tax=Streptomyces triculaminicus TaxID=2816232 RepID=UPI0037AD6B2E
MSKPIKFGTPPGVKEGDWFADHDDLYAKDVHRGRGRGISGTAKTGVDSIVMSGGYIDDDDRGDEIFYTGAGGRDRDTGRLISDQTLEERGNAGLVFNQAAGHPVRVIEGLEIRGKKRRRATGGYRYRGLYRVADHWMTPGKEGFVICRFHLVKMEHDDDISPQPEAVSTTEGVDADMTPLEAQVRRYINSRQLARDTAAANRIKDMYRQTCQMCDLRLVVSPTGEAYSEAAHIQALGKPHGGPDVIENILCLCPNCHALFDRGALQISDSLDVIDGLSGQYRRALTRLSEHRIQVSYVRQHRSRWADRNGQIGVFEL